MSSQKMLDFDEILAPSLLEGASEAQLSRHIPADGPPGHGRHIVTCKRCGRTRRKVRRSDYCTDACGRAWRHEKQARIEAGKKRRAMRGSAALHAGHLCIAREAAMRVLARDGDADADRVRRLLEAEGTELPWTSGWPGSIFSADPGHAWVTVRRAKSTHKGGKCREIRVWK